jgi:trans-2,3-dihydro-3-hydroxyanthranilate isomerase
VEILQGVEIDRPSLMLARAEGDGEDVVSVEVGGSGALFARGTAVV